MLIPDHGDPVASVVLSLALVLVAARLGGELAVRLRQPEVLGELVVTVTALDTPQAAGLRRTVAVAEGLAVSYSPALRLTDTAGLEPAEAVRSYHAALARHKIRPYRSLEEDLNAMPRAAAYGGTPARNAVGNSAVATAARPDPDFAKMTQAEKIAWNRERWKRILG